MGGRPKALIIVMVQQYLFFLHNDMISVVHLDHAKKFFYEKKMGETIFPIENDFWDWWKYAVSFTKEDVVDFCFLYDKNYDIILKSEFLKKLLHVEQSIWDMWLIELFFKVMTGYTKISVYGKNDQVYKIYKDNLEFGDNLERIFYTNIECLNRNRQRETFSMHQEITELAMHFRKQMEEENR